MDPNSQHQVWSQWTYTVSHYATKPSFASVKDNCARFGRKGFGTAAKMRVRQFIGKWEISILAEGVSIQDPRYVQWMHAQWETFLLNGFGLCVIEKSAKLMAGSPQTGAPADQMIIIPPIVMDPQ